jgi:hypothetical protein
MENVTIPEMMLVTVSNTLTTKASLQTGRKPQGKEVNQRPQGQRSRDLHKAVKWMQNVYLTHIIMRGLHSLHTSFQ